MESKDCVRIAVFNEKTGKEVKGYAVKDSNGKDISKYIWNKCEDDGYFNANMTISYFDGKLGNGLFFQIVECNEKGE